MKKVPGVTKSEQGITEHINAWTGPLVAGIVLAVIGIALFFQCQAPAGKHKKARVRVPSRTVAVTPVAASGSDSWNGGSSSQQNVNSILF